MTDSSLKHALIVAHGQPSDPEPPERRLADMARDVQSHLKGWQVRSATIAAPNALEAQVAEMPAGGVIYPMFMSDGWFVSRVLPRRLGQDAPAILPPLGFDPNLPALAADILRNALLANGWREEESTVLLAAHGSGRGDKAAKAARAFVNTLQPLVPKMKIALGFIEEEPYVDAAAMGLGPRSICLPYFALEGDHCREDIPEALEKADFKGKLLRPLGEDPNIPKLIARALDAA